jgi:hypothetical protein
VFRKICPTDEFMPRPPDPEDIDYQSDETKKEDPTSSSKDKQESSVQEPIDKSNDNTSVHASINDNK